MITIDGYPLDLVVTEEHSLTSEITDHPVEKGSDISDNIRRKPRELTLTNAVVSDTPIGGIATDSSRVALRQDENGQDVLPSSDAYQRLVAIWEAGNTVTVVTNLQKYDDMAIESITVPQDAKSAGGLIFTVHFKQVTIVKNNRVTVAVPNLGGELNLGLGLDKLISGKNILWRKGKPPGLSPATEPKGVITGQEVVSVVKGASGKPSKFTHANGKELTTEELTAFAKDLDRDSALSTERGLARAQAQLDQDGKIMERSQKMLDYKTAHPGSQPDPAQFGLQKGSNGRWKAR
jgi:hypothetical protein